jgi:hypothetical protein
MIRFKVTIERKALPTTSYLLVRAENAEQAGNYARAWLNRLSLEWEPKDMRIVAVEPLRDDEFKNSKYFIN